MIRMVNHLTGGTMWVSDDRVEEYLKLGHRLEAPPTPTHPIRREKASEPDSKKTTTSRSRKR